MQNAQIRLHSHVLNWHGLKKQSAADAHFGHNIRMVIKTEAQTVKFII